jgi:SWI/SNF-related matrix-associated actin-dependent regulator 1 of chromatin subfamily A
MTDVLLINDNQSVRFHKKMWHITELNLAKCYDFEINIDTGMIVAHLKHTYKQCIYEFIRLSFKNFSEAHSETERRNRFYEKIESVYSTLEQDMNALMVQKLPYYNQLYSHQKEGIMFGSMRRAIFLAYEMRLGKSITAASLSRIFNVRRTVIICPAIAKWGWYRDLTSTWGFNELYFTMLDSTKSKSFTALQERFVIVNFDILKKFDKHICSDDVGHFIIDEAHRIKNRASDRSKVIQDIVDRYPNAKITFLSGTPVANRFNDLFNYFKLAKHPLGDSYKKFTDEYTIKTASRSGERVTGAKNINDLKMKMLNFMIVKRMDECFDMPEDVVSKYTFDFDDYREEYDAIIEEMVAAKESSALSVRSNLHSLNIITCKSKLKGIIEAIEEILTETKKIVVFGSYKEPLAALEQYFGSRCVKVDGSTASFDRDGYKRKFWDDDNVEVFLGNYQAAGEALDLSCSNDVFCINFPFTPRELNQALFRCKHPEKKGHIRRHYTFAKGSIDEYIYDIIASKEKDINQLVAGGKEVIEKDNIEEILINKLLNKVPEEKESKPVYESVKRNDSPESDVMMEAIERNERNGNMIFTPPPDL